MLKKNRMKLFKWCLLVSFLFLLFFSCKKESISSHDLDYNYFPTKTGTYVIYDVDSVYHSENDNNTDDSIYFSHYQVKEVILKTFLDGENRPIQMVMRYARKNNTLDWNAKGVFTQLLTETSAFRTEENIVLHKLAFPVNDRISWNGNDGNTLEEEIFNYEKVHTPMTLGTLAFDSTITVRQADASNFIEKIYGVEVYAANVGLVYKERVNLRKLNGMVVKGTEFKMKVRSFGIE